MKNKNSSERGLKIKKQLISTGLYISLAATVLGITSNSVKKILGGTADYEIPENGGTNIVLPTLDDPKENDLPKQAAHEFPADGAGDMVSEQPDGVTAEITENAQSEAFPLADSTPIASEALPPEGESVSGEPADVQTLPETQKINENTVPSVRVRPVAGYISREFSADELLYTPTMNDFRTHHGIDITGDIGSPVSAFADGEIADVYNDPFMGTTVVIRHSGGLVSSYSNLSEELPQGIAVGNFVKVGDTIGGIGETAIIESAEVPHVHFEIYKDEICVNPEDYIS